MEIDKEYASSDLESGHEAGQKFLAIIDIWDFLRVRRHLLSVLVLIDHINCLICLSIYWCEKLECSITHINFSI